MKRMVSLMSVLAMVLVWTWITPANAASAKDDGISLAVENGGDDVPATTVKPNSNAVATPSQLLQPINHVNFGEEAVRITSLCASTSTNKQRSYWNAMGGLVGVSVSTDRIADPAAWYNIPMQQPYGWQWFDAVTTTFHSFMGSATLLNSIDAGEFGSRLVIHASGKYPVSAYTCTVSCGLTNGLSATFPVGTNTTNGAELAFGPNFIGINTGANGVCESFYDPSTGLATAGGDDVVYQNTERPSQVHYDWWVRFGASSVITIGQPSDFAGVRTQFATNQSFTASLLRSNVVVSTKTIVEARPQLSIVPDVGSLIRLSIDGGQGNTVYGLLSSTNVGGAYVPYWVDQTFYTGSPYVVTNDGSVKRFFRLVEKPL